MDFLVALVAPALSKSLEVCFLTGFISAYRLKEIQRDPRGGVRPLPRLTFRRRRRRSGYSRSQSLTKSAKELPNDPEREGNIWHQYEQLELTKRALEKQIQDERAFHKKELRRLETQSGPRARRVEDDLPPTQRLEDKSAPELASELSETRMELEQTLVDLSDAHNQVDFLRSEKQSLEAENARLRKAANPNNSAANRKNSGALPARAAPETPFQTAGAMGAFADEVAAEARQRRGEPLATFGSDIEFSPNVLPQGASVARDSQNIAQAFKGGAVSTDKLLGQNKHLQAENQRLQTKLLRLDSHRADALLQEKYDKVVEENNRLQKKVLRLDMGSGNGADRELINVLQEENAGLVKDNDYLVTFLENLEKEKQTLEERMMNNPGNQRLATQVEQLSADNAVLLDKIEKLKARLQDAQLMNTNGSFTIPIPVDVSTGAEQDKDMWMLIENLREHIRLLEAKGATARPNNGDQTEAEMTYTSLLTEENSALQNEIFRLNQQLGSGVPQQEREALDEALKSNQRLLAEKSQVKSQLESLVTKNSNLIMENRDLIKQLHSPDNIIKTKESLQKADSKGMLSRFKATLKPGKQPSQKLTKAESDDSFNEASSSAAASEFIRKADSPSKQLVSDLLEENGKLIDERNQLATRAELVDTLKFSNESLTTENQKLKQSVEKLTEVTKDNDRLQLENSQMSQRVNECLTENKELQSRLSALQYQEQTVEAALGPSKPSTRPGPPRQELTAAQRQSPLPQQPSFAAFMTPGSLPSNASRQFEQRVSGMPPTPIDQRISMGAKSAPSPWDMNFNSYNSAESSRGNNSISMNDLPPIGLPRKDLQGPPELKSEFDLSKYIEDSRRLAEMGHNTSTPEQKQLAEQIVQEKSSKYCRNDDLGGFMTALKYPGFQPAQGPLDDDSVDVIYHQALNLLYDIQVSDTTTDEEKLLATCAWQHLEQWYVTWIERAAKAGRS